MPDNSFPGPREPYHVTLGSMAQVQVGDSVWLQPPWALGALAQGQIAAVATVAAGGRVLPLMLQVQASLNAGVCMDRNTGLSVPDNCVKARPMWPHDSKGCSLSTACTIIILQLIQAALQR